MHGLELAIGFALNVLRAFGDTDIRALVMWTLAGTLVWSGVAKIRRPVFAATALVQFGLARTASAARGRLLGVFELALALLLASGQAPFGALVVATLLFASFAVLIGLRLRAGDTRPCYCFGSDAPLSRIGFSRALGLALVAAATAAGAPTWAPLPALSSIAFYAAGAAALVGQAALIAALPTALRLTSETGERSSV